MNLIGGVAMANADSIQARMGNAICESCGDANAKWHFQEGELGIPGSTGTGLDLSKGLPVHAVICGNCGFIRLYSALVGT
jgi:predicted nucleic-acid-binding Zn-ribbon protein